MDSADFVKSEFGEPGKWGKPVPYCVYLPKPMPRLLRLDPETAVELSNADRALGRLAGSGRRLKTPYPLAQLYIRREAVSSTRIEGTQATLDDLYDAESGGAVGADVIEVLNYLAAMDIGLEMIQTSPITLEMVKQLHVALLAGARGENKQPGQVRNGPNWIGSNDPATARFVPPPHTELERGLRDWEQFIADDLVMPPLVACALLHYQFETLHPFLDGNGRLGRLLIILFLVQKGHLPVPLLYVSSYFENHKEQYYDSLQGVRERGDIQTWVQFFLRAIGVQANDAVRRSERLLDLGEEFRTRLKGSRGRAHELIDTLISMPVITTQQVKAQLHISTTGATNILRQLEGVGILAPLPRLPGRSNRWVAHEVRQAQIEDLPEVD